MIKLLIKFLSKNGIDFTKACLALLEQTDIGAVMLLKAIDEEKLKEFKTLLFTVPAGISTAQALLAWLDAQNAGTRAKFEALFETFFAAAIDVAVVGSLLDEETFKLTAPVIFTAALGAKGLYKGLTSAYLYGKASVQEDNGRLLSQAFDSLVISISASLVSVGVKESMIDEINYLALIGFVGAGVIGVSFAGYKLISAIYQSLVAQKMDPEATALLSSEDLETISAMESEIETLESQSTEDEESESQTLSTETGENQANPREQFGLFSRPTTSHSHQSINNDLTYNAGEDDATPHRTCGVQ